MAPIIGTELMALVIRTDICTQCTIYKSLAANLFNEMRSIKKFVSGMAGMTSNALHEKVLTKELVLESQLVIVKHRLSGAKKGKMTQQVHKDANKELEHLQAMPTASHKWTWGESLTQDEVRSLRHTSKKCL